MLASGRFERERSVRGDNMNYFAWIREQQGPVAQLWDEDHTSKFDHSKRLTEKLIVKHKLPKELQNKTLDELIKLLPCPKAQADG